MQQLKTYTAIIATAALLLSCASHTASPKAADKNATLLIDTNKLKADAADIINSVTSGKLDTDKLKTAGSDILKTDATILSDSGIARLGDSTDPAVRQAQKTMIKMRNAMGITPAALDSIRKAAETLSRGTKGH
jgi:PBP1b-binding outer membrane lipoprotein LpoB